MRKVSFFVMATLLVASCGSPRSVVRVKNNAEGVTTQVTTNVGAGGSTTVTVSPNTEAIIGEEVIEGHEN